METVPVRLKKEERAVLEATAESLSAALGLPVSLTDAFLHLLRHLPADAVDRPSGWTATGPSSGVFAMNLEGDQVAALDALAQRLAQRRSRVLGGNQQPVRSEAIRFAIQSGAHHLTEGVN